MLNRHNYVHRYTSYLDKFQVYADSLFGLPYLLLSVQNAQASIIFVDILVPHADMHAEVSTASNFRLRTRNVLGDIKKND